MARILLITNETYISISEIEKELQSDNHEVLIKTSKNYCGAEIDFESLHWADICILTLPSTSAALLAAGWMLGNGKNAIGLKAQKESQIDSCEMLDYIVDSKQALRNAVRNIIVTSMNCIRPIDMGLSVLWADRNLGAEDISRYGGYYGWKYINGRYILQDSSRRNVPKLKGWRLPTIEEVVELRDKCKWEYRVIDTRGGMNASGPSGDSIFLPYADYINEKWHITAPTPGSAGLYLSSSIRNGDCTFLRLINYRREIEYRGDITGYMSVRLVKDIK